MSYPPALDPIGWGSCFDHRRVVRELPSCKRTMMPRPLPSQKRRPDRAVRFKLA